MTQTTVVAAGAQCTAGRAALLHPACARQAADSRLAAVHVPVAAAVGAAASKPFVWSLAALVALLSMLGIGLCLYLDPVVRATMRDA